MLTFDIKLIFDYPFLFTFSSTTIRLSLAVGEAVFPVLRVNIKGEVSSVLRSFFSNLKHNSDINQSSHLLPSQTLIHIALNYHKSSQTLLQILKMQFFTTAVAAFALMAKLVAADGGPGIGTATYYTQQGVAGSSGEYHNVSLITKLLLISQSDIIYLG